MFLLISQVGTVFVRTNMLVCQWISHLGQRAAPSLGHRHRSLGVQQLQFVSLEAGSLDQGAVVRPV